MRLKTSSGARAQQSPAPVQNFILIAFHQLRLLLPVSPICMLWSLCHPASEYSQGSTLVLMETALWDLILPPHLCCVLCQHPCLFWKQKTKCIHTQAKPAERTVNQRRNASNLPFPGTLSFQVSTGSGKGNFLPCQAICEFYIQTPKLACIFTHLYVSVCADKVT